MVLCKSSHITLRMCVLYLGRPLDGSNSPLSHNSLMEQMSELVFVVWEATGLGWLQLHYMSTG